MEALRVLDGIGGHPIVARVAVGVFAVAVVASIWVGVSMGRPSGPAYEHPAAKTVGAVLTLRYARSADPAAYAPYFLDSAIATELAMSSKELTQPPIPLWEAPYVSSEGTAGVDVVVKWAASGQRPAPSGVGVVFTLARMGAGWAISDAQEVVGMPPSPLGER